MAASSEDAERAAVAYYDDADAHLFFTRLWGGEDLHIGLYDRAGSVREASDAIVDRMASMVPHLRLGTVVVDLGSGFGGTMRRLASHYPIRALCLNISERQNALNRERIAAAGLEERIAVVHGSFERIPLAGGRIGVVWSQDALLHAPDRGAVLAEAFRVLEPDGLLIFTDILKHESAPDEALAPIRERLGVRALGTESGDRALAEAAGFQPLPFVPLTPNFRRHYHEIGQSLVAAREELIAQGGSASFLDRMLTGVRDWIASADAGHIVWGIERYIK